MGVKGLWSVLEPVLEPVTLADLQGLRLAVDLSIWLHEGMAAFCHTKGKAPLLHKKNLFQRVRNMLQHGIRPVFVMEGRPPALKADCLERRQKAGGYQDNSQVEPFSRLSEECKELFNAMNVPYVVSEGEAEAFCGQLCTAGLVDGVITDDGDAFLFGATVIYKNFTADLHKSEQMQRCRMSDVESKLHLDRERLVALGLLTGCDYTVGVRGVGPEAALSFFREAGPQLDILQRFQAWRDDKELDDVTSFKSLPKPPHCGKCGHIGNKRSHDKDGCERCGSTKWCLEDNKPCVCDYHNKMERYKSRSAECSIRTKALSVGNFPDQQVIDAFLKPKNTLPTAEFVWQKPEIAELKSFLRKKFNWNSDEALENCLTLYTGYDMVDSLRNNCPCKSVPLKIFKKRMRHFSVVFEVQWRFIDGITDDVEHLITLEDAKLFYDCYPEIVCAYDAMVLRKNSSQGRKRKPEGDAQMKIDQMFKVRKKLSFTPVKSDKSPAGQSVEIQDSSPESQQLPQTPPRRSPRLSPGKNKSLMLSPSHLHSTSKTQSRKGFLPKRLHFSREMTPDRSDLRSTEVTAAVRCPTPVNGTSELPEPESTPVNASAFFNNKTTWLPTLSPMKYSPGDSEDRNSCSVSKDASLQQDYQQVKQSLDSIDLADKALRTPLTAPKPASKSTGKSKPRSKSTSRKIKSPDSTQMRINKFVKRRLNML